jgi:seryl-tRNA synthetase
MAKKEKRWASLTKAEKLGRLRDEIDKILKGLPRTAARSTKRLTDVDRTLSDKIEKLAAQVDELAKELQDTKRKLDEVTPPEGPTAS